LFQCIIWVMCDNKILRGLAFSTDMVDRVLNHPLLEEYHGSLIPTDLFQCRFRASLDTIFWSVLPIIKEPIHSYGKACKCGTQSHLQGKTELFKY
jgi:hypothetical protein